MEFGKFGLESSPSFPDDGGEKSEPKKKKKKHAAGDGSDRPRQDETAKDRGPERPKRPSPDTLAPLLERITSDMKPDERRVAEADKRSEEKGKTAERTEDRSTSEAPKNSKEEDGTDPEKLSAEERREAAKVYLDEREQRVAGEREGVVPETTGANVAEAVDAFLARTREKLAAKPEADVDEAADESFDEIAQEYAPDIHTEPGAAEEQAAGSESTPEGGVSSTLEVVPGMVTDTADEQAQTAARNAQDIADPMAYEDMIPHLPRGADVLPGGGEASMVAPYELPLAEETEQHQPPVEPVAYAYNFQPPQIQHRYNQPPIPVAVASGAERVSRAEEVGVPVAVPLVVGLAAYFFGKHRGRIKAEQRLVPIQKKLEREVRMIHEKLAAKETELRNLVRKQAEIRPVAEQPFTQYGRELAVAGVGAAAGVEAVRDRADRPAPIRTNYEAAQGVRPSVAAETLLRRDTPNVRTPEQIAAMPLTDVPEQEPPFTPNRATEANPNMTPPPEVPGQSPRMADKAPFEAYSTPSNRYERPRQDTFTAPEAAPLPGLTVPRQEMPVSSMTREEVAKAADEIIVGAATVRQVFETGLISERGMRRVVAEARRGGDARNVLAEEMMIKETGYERDPRLRDQPAQHSSSSSSVQAHTPQDASPAASQHAEEENALPAPSSAAHPVLPARTTHHGISPLTQSALIAANVIALVILGILLLVLFVIHL